MALATIPARLVEAENNITRSGVGGIVDATVVESGDVVLLTAQIVGAQNGLYVVGTGTWARHADFSVNTQMLRGTTVFIEEGSPYNEGSEWFFSTVNSSPAGITVGATDLYFDRRSWPSPVLAGAGVDVEGGTVSLREQMDVQGIFINPTVQYNSQGIAVYTTSGSFSEDLREGLGLKWLSGTSVEIGEGQAWIPGGGGGEGELLTVNFPITKSGLILPASSIVYLYLWENGGSPDIEFSTQVPASPYYGKARTKGGPDNTTPDVSPDDTRRLIYAVRTDASGNILSFGHRSADGFTRYRANQDTTLRVVSSATNTTTSAVDISPLVPVGAESVLVAARLVNTDNPSNLYISAAGDGLQTVGGSTGAGQMRVGNTLSGSASAQQYASPIALVGGNRTLHHRQLAVGASRSADIDILGFWMEV